MPIWNLGELMSEATTLAGYRDDIGASRVSFYVNQAQTDFARDFKEFYSEKTQVYSVSSGDSVLALPNDFGEPIALSQFSTDAGQHFDIPPISAEYADTQGYLPVGAPKGYFIYGSNIQLWPSASSSENTTHASSVRQLLLRYKWIPEDMVSTTSVPSVHTEHRIALLHKTVEYLHRRTGNLEEAIVAEATYTQHLAAFKDARAKRQSARGNFKIRMADRSSRRLDGRLEDQTDEWLRR